MVNEPKPEELVRNVEAILFSYGKRVQIEEIARLCRCKNYPDVVKEALGLLKQEYDEKQNALMVVQDGEFWKLTTRERFSNVVSKIVPHTELSKTILETLAIVAWKAPMRQSELIEIRTNKAYDHVNELVDSGFLSKEKYGRTYLLKLTQKFFDYFDLRNVEEAHKMFDKMIPDKEKKEMEEKIKAAKEAVDSKELVEELPQVEIEKQTKATIASELITAAKSIKMHPAQYKKQMPIENAEAAEAYGQREESENPEIEQTEDNNQNDEQNNKQNNEQNHNQNNSFADEDLEDEIIDEELKEFQEELPEADLESDSEEKNSEEKNPEERDSDEKEKKDLTRPEEE